MESKAHYALIGTLVLAFLVAALSAIVWLSGNSLDTDYEDYTVRFDGPIRGVQQAAEVRFNGIKVGEVTSLRLDPSDTNKVLVTVTVQQETPVDTLSYAQLEPQGLTGLNIIQLFSGGRGSPLLRDMPDDDGPHIIDGRESQFDSLLTGSGSIVESVQQTLQRFLGLLDEASVNDVKLILSNVEAITKDYREDPLTANRIEQTLAAIDQASADVSIASLSVDQTSLETRVLIQEQVTPLIGRLENTITEIEVTLKASQGLLQSSQEVASSATGTLNAFSSGALLDLEQSLSELTDLISTLNNVAEELERNPSSFIVGEKKEVMELPR